MDIKCLSDLEKYIKDKTYWSITREKQDDIFEIWTFSQYTPEFEDFSFSVGNIMNCNNVLEGIKKTYDDFDVDEHVKLYIDMIGKNGVPNSISRLVADAQWIERDIKALGKEVQKVLQPEKTK